MIGTPVIVHFGSLTATAAAAAGGVSVDQIAVAVPAALAAGDYNIGIKLTVAPRL